MKFIFALFVLLLGLAGGYMAYDLTTPLPTPGANSKVLIEISRGMSPRSLCRELSSKQLARQSDLCYFYGKIFGVWHKLQAGVYEFNSSDSLRVILRKLERAESKMISVTVVEGDNRFQIAEKIQGLDLKFNTEFERLTERDPNGNAWWANDLPEAFRGVHVPNLEGFLYPDTYYFAQGISTQEVIRMMLRRFKAEWNSIPFAQAKKPLPAYPLLILSSMIEKETGMADQRTSISSVFHNRLEKKMRLQSDPTTIFGIWKRFTGPQHGNLHRSDLQESTPYNTYTIASLPPGPICSPGRQSIDAALNPINSKYLYFVARKDGTTQFSETLQQHNEAVRRFQLNGL